MIASSMSPLTWDATAPAARSPFEEMKAFVRFGEEDGRALRDLAPQVGPHLDRIVDDFYERLEGHEAARRTLDSPERVARHRLALRLWMESTLAGPWDESYFAARLRIGEAHVGVGLPQRYMFGGMNVLRLALEDIAEQAFAGDRQRRLAVRRAIGKICDIELAVMLHAYGEAFVRRVQELERQKRTALSERLKSLSILAAGLAHEIRNPLNSAHLQLELARRKLTRGQSSDVAGALHSTESVGAELSRLAVLLDEFLEFARPQAIRRVRADLRKTAEAVVDLLRPEAERSEINLSLVPGAPVAASVDEGRIKQVLVNLIRNAVEAVESHGHVTVGVVADRRIRLTVEDDGPGIPPNARIFEPFFTTKACGTGLGLTIVHRIVSDHQGSVDFESCPGRTVFTVTLPQI
jgi:signal transduction histidine kinase